MTAIGYSKEFKERAIQAFLSRGKRSVREISREFGVSHSTLFGWVSFTGIDMSKVAENKRPEDWVSSERMHAISIFDELDENERVEFLRSCGLSTAHIEKWRQMLYAALEVRDQEKNRLEIRIRILEKDLERKDKALAEAAAILILQKKTQKLLNLVE